MRYGKDIKDFVVANGRGRTTGELVTLIRERFALELEPAKVNSLRYRLGAKSGIDTRIRKGQKLSPETCFKKGNVPFTKGRSWNEWAPSEKTREAMRKGHFKSGHMPHNHMPVGSVVIKADGYQWKKVAEPNRWRQLHHLVWEAVNGPIPPHHCVAFRNGDRMDVRLENLILISRDENAMLNSIRCGDGDLLDTAVTLHRLEQKIRKTKKRV